MKITNNLETQKRQSDIFGVEQHRFSKTQNIERNEAAK